MPPENVPVTVIVPWRPAPSRVPAFEFVLDWYARRLPEFAVKTVDTDDDVFVLAACRNLGIASADPDEVVVVCDADTLPEPEPLRAAVAAARTSGLVHLPYTEYRWLGRSGDAQLRAGVPAEECEHELVIGACSGVYVTTPRTWARHGGQDERFRGWGFEDAAWYLAHGALLGQPPVQARGPGVRPAPRRRGAGGCALRRQRGAHGALSRGRGRPGRDGSAGGGLAGGQQLVGDRRAGAFGLFSGDRPQQPGFPTESRTALSAAASSSTVAAFGSSARPMPVRSIAAAPAN